ncbi:MAG: AAA family ATPase [Lachnospiraceae bacterium]|nr:AAA family ATPase [Lachnospiraceae bacterium]
MGIPVLILGESGSGKTFAIKNMNPDEVGIFLVEKPRLPFRKQFRCKQNATYFDIMKALSDPKLKQYVIDDSQYLLVNEFFDRASEVGYQKFTDMALNFRNLIHFVINKAPEDVIVYFLHHTETDNNGKVKAKTIGKMLDEKLTVEGLFDIVLRTEINTEGHWFLTQSSGYDTTKSPEEMFLDRIPNDLALVDKTIREYYGMEPITKTKKTEEK